MPKWSVASADRAFREGTLQAWIEAYLQEPEWANPGLLRRVRAYSVSWPAPQLIGVDQFRRVAGPGPEFRFPKDPAKWETDIAAILARSFDPDQVPLVLGWIDPDESINLADGNHRVEASKRLGITHLWSLIHQTPLREPGP